MPTINKHVVELLLVEMSKLSLNSAITIYNILEKQGLKYASLAKCIAKGNNLIGFCTNHYLQTVAKWQTGLIINNHANADILLDHIKIAMAYQYAQYIIDKYNKSHDKNNNCIIQQISLTKIRELHSKVFTQFGLSSDVWILAIPFKIYDCLDALKQQYRKTYH
ncbi:hypothetical protein [Entomomonas asaccharolytica]|uniref:Uncharacterized protein n=1 Tax=Entomomonas asaccharolytica TaxID=2785331 RepID=A0A974NDT4_9GAMM|nr:hypothetical protein [Entomomonas asaccharolytica]QQP84527.1 hypothetical protein JHT90_08865 [Entomomonas asaccharolytica]